MAVLMFEVNEMEKTLLRALSIGLLLPLAAGCATTRLLPADGYASVSRETAGLVVTAYEATRKERPYEAPRRFTCISVIVENDRDEPIRVELDNFTLLLDEKRQLKPQPPEYVSDTIYPVKRERVYLGLGVGVASDDVPMWTGARFGFNDRTTDIFVDAFQPGDIEPGASAKGVLYFNRIPKGAGKATLRLRIGEEYADLPFTIR